MTEQDAVTTAKDLTDAVNGLAGKVAKLAAFGRRNRRLIRLTIISLILDLVLTGFVYYSAHRANEAIATARSAYASNRALCEAGNTARAKQIQLWDFVLSLSAKPRAPAQRKVIAAFETRLHQIFAPRDCAALGSKATTGPR